VLSELQRPQGDPRVRTGVERIDADRLFLSAITLGELTKGVTLLSAGRRKTELHSWLSGLEQQFGDRILGIDSDIARMWGKLTARAQAKGVQIPSGDGLIAATAIHHGLTVMTRNSRHFTASGALIMDPWSE
jgi:predicted nucleic acid-binding protein